MDFSPYGSDFLNEIRSSLENHNVAHAVAIINDNRYFENLKNNCWDLVPVITKYLSSDYENDKLEVFKGCEELLNKIAENSNPEEALLQFIEEIEESEDDTKFVTILFPMLKVLQRIPKNRLNSLAWCLNAIQTYLNKIETSGNEKMVFRTELLYHDVLRFYDILIPYYSVKLNSSTNKNFPLVICKYLIELLGRPLGFLNLTFVEIKSRIRKIAENIVEKVLLVCADPFIYLEMEKSDFLVPSVFSYGVFFYLIVCEKIKYEVIPKVYNLSYLCYSSLKYCTELLRRNQQLVIEKGLSLSEILLQGDKKLSHLVLELDVNKEYSEVLENIIVFNEDEKCRTRAFQIFKIYLEAFDVRGQYLLFCSLVQQIKHSGLTGFVITYYKEVLVRLQISQDVDLKYFEKERLNSFILKCCDITKNDENHLLNKGDKVMALLNLMRFVVLQQKSDNLNNFKNVVKIWREIYLDPLSELLEDSQAVFKKKKSEIEHEMSPHDEPQLSFSVGEEETLEVSKFEKLQSIDLTLTGFEMIGSLLDRLIELLKLKNCY